jgi:2'-5' RNA ligase
MKEIAIIYLLPEEVSNYYQVLRHKIAERFGLEFNHNIPAHITLKYGFPIENLGEIERVMQDFCVSQPKAKWELHDFNYFVNPEKNVVFIDAKPSKNIRKVHASFIDNLKKIDWVQWRQFDNANFHYHVTLASNGISSDNFVEVWSFLNQQIKPNYEVNFDNLALFRIDIEPPIVYKTYRFPD